MGKKEKGEEAKLVKLLIVLCLENKVLLFKC